MQLNVVVCAVNSPVVAMVVNKLQCSSLGGTHMVGGGGGGGFSKARCL